MNLNYFVHLNRGRRAMIGNGELGQKNAPRFCPMQNYVDMKGTTSPYIETQSMTTKQDLRSGRASKIRWKWQVLQFKNGWKCSIYIVFYLIEYGSASAVSLSYYSCQTKIL